jgi:glyoxylase I family protein
MLKLQGIHHVAVIRSDYAKSKDFYTRILGMEIIRETYRPGRNSHKLDLALNGMYILELFSFDQPPKRSSYPEAAGLRHLAFGVDSIHTICNLLEEHKISFEPVRTDDNTGKQFTFIADPDDLPIEFYEL